MDATDKLVNKFLAHLGYKKVVYEPDGNVPPDFLVEDRIAVEVRRLNQSHDTGTTVQGLEEVAIPLWRKVEALALSLGPPTHAVSWFVYFRFSRPVEHWKTLKPKLEAALQAFKSAPTHGRTRLSLAPGFELEIFPAASLHPTFYLMGGRSDDQSGGLLIEEVEKNLKICIDDKTQKIQNFKAKYPEWWLVLVDHIAYGLDQFDVQQLKAHTSVSHTWDRVIVIDPNNPTRSFEV